MTAPALTATYRLQLHAGFTLADARRLVPYLQRLGVSHLYASPLLAARAGSTHGYDVIDPTRLNPALGTDDDLHALADDLRSHGMGLLLDFVPNHMGIGPENPYWEDLLEHGERSRWAGWFDVDWEVEQARTGRRRVVLPVLSDAPNTLIDRGELQLDVTGKGPRLVLGEESWPVDPATLPDESELARFDPGAAAAFGERAAMVRTVLGRQHYRLTHWRRIGEINYRRFFDVNDLAGVRVEDPAVFAATHALVFRWIEEGVVNGLRIDHVDGLADPEGYLRTLRAECERRAGAGFPIVVEKILAPDEHLRESWPVDGTTGYEFLNAVERLFVDPDGAARVETAYRHIRRLKPDETFAKIAAVAKTRVLTGPLQADVARVRRSLGRSLGRALPDDVTDALVRFIVHLPVYRTYVTPPSVPDPDDVAVTERALANARRFSPPERASTLDLVADAILGRLPASDDAAREGYVRRLQQTTGPAAAKGIEDTALYAYAPLASLGEVGGAPDTPVANAAERLHRENAERAAHWPRSLLAVTTHDTKRSADVRARLDALSLVPDDWARSVARWRRLNRRHRSTVRGRVTPGTHLEYVLYQALVGIWPAPRPDRRADDLPDPAWRDAAGERLRQYALKAAREAKQRTSWIDPDPEYETALRTFVEGILTPAADAPFLQDVARLVSLIAPAGARFALARQLIQIASPGTPDVYQGDELWNMTLVDPDNRRPVDFDVRARLLDELAAGEKALASLGTADSRLKLAVTSRLLRARRERAELFRSAHYIPLTFGGDPRPDAFAFARATEDAAAVAIATWPGSSAELAARTASDRWGTSSVALPPALGNRSWFSVLDGKTHIPADDRLPLSAVLGELGVALLLSP